MAKLCQGEYIPSEANATLPANRTQTKFVVTVDDCRTQTWVCWNMDMEHGTNVTFEPEFGADPMFPPVSAELILDFKNLNPSCRMLLLSLSCKVLSLSLSCRMLSLRIRGQAGRLSST